MKSLAKVISYLLHVYISDISEKTSCSVSNKFGLYHHIMYQLAANICKSLVMASQGLACVGRLLSMPAAGH